MVGEMDSDKQDVPFFTKLFTLAQILGILSIVLIGVWGGVFRGGFAWTSDPALQFNWHPFLMVFGMVFLYANGALIYRGFRFEKKKKLKLLHMLTMLGAFVCSVVGLVAVFDSHNYAKPNPIPNMYSLHSWMGLATVLLFCFQWVSGLVTFLLPGLRPSVRSAYLPVHQFFGLFIFVSGIATALVGITEKTFFTMMKTYSNLPPEAILINFSGITLILFGAIVVYLATNPKFRRLTTEDEVLLTDTVLE
ncbi:hypothetical protein Pcinc_030539 [Petrolisthes cinctipes]|uniref:Cytochrome b561 domain-containing protein n=1 Tax=Petrolisthes cinctipes TaxID=88211 RepID=A0AAE1EY66_PETCI|nr:hypothetical protein Pcinc_030539 [Petrolisthes cinctipes]